MSEEEEKIHVKLIMNKGKTKVLFAEAGSDFVDALLSFLPLPLGTIVKVLKKQFGEKVLLAGSLKTLYNGLANLDTIHFLTEDAKILLLNPTSLDEDEQLPLDEVFTETTASFIISDDLKVMRSVEGSVMSTLRSLGIAITDMDGAEIRDMHLGYAQMMTLMAIMFVSRNPLTTLLLLTLTRQAAGQGNAVNQIGKRAHCMNTKKISLTAMMQKSTNKLLFAQARHDFVSFLFGLLAIPLGRVEWFLHSNTGVRATDNLHRSIPDSLYCYNIMTTETKDMLFKPAMFNEPSSNGSSSRVRTSHNGFCNEYLPLNFALSENKDYVKGSSMYMVKDDLTVAPLSVTSSVSVINEMKVALSDVVELEMEVGLEEGLSILKAALTSTTALTDGLIKPMLKNQPKQEN
ncbi:uncharacterized protein LOC131009392 [Salvia miltiorrhiza]|uniref:uncharacterized protein LOC131009392 n=1 Tax=Salvia miltiorrhiza TaxID=226208 RepID=UPI0025ABF4A7|nr:uncharacterized protein LOC131009392 [Salvia miltiorrhiza]